MGELFDPAAYGGSVTQNPTRPIYAPPPPPAAAATAAQAAGQPGSSAYNDSNTSYYTPAGYHDPAGGFIPYSSSNQMPLYYANGGNYPGS
jgi:hypothetical protein